jgi:hypothetical protein
MGLDGDLDGARCEQCGKPATDEFYPELCEECGFTRFARALHAHGQANPEFAQKVRENLCARLQTDWGKYVVHNKRSKHDVYIGRPSVWGNKFSHLEKSAAEYKCSTREESILKYQSWLRKQPELIAQAKRELRGKVLGCWCAPKACHGLVLAKFANE